MDELIIDDPVVLVGEYGPCADVGVEAAIEEQARLGAEECRKLRFEREMVARVAVQEARGWWSVRGWKGLKSREELLTESGRASEGEVVVGGEVDEWLLSSLVGGEGS